jgi:hypothetical protein
MSDMKNKVINFYGCSFSHGGGLDNTKYFDYARRNNLIVDSVSFETATARHKFSKSCRFSTLVGKHFDCEVNNFSQTGNNNDNIAQKVYSNLSNNNGDIHIVQFSFYPRQKVYLELTDEFYRLSTTFLEDYNHEQKSLYRYYRSFIKHHYKQEYEQYKVKMYIDMLDSYAKSKSKKIYWMFWDRIPSGTLEYKDVSIWSPDPTGEYGSGTMDLNIDTDNLISFPPGGHMYEWAVANKLLIRDETKGYYQDGHLSQKGNRAVSDKIIEVLS